jgi:hypothetical protein
MYYYNRKRKRPHHLPQYPGADSPGRAKDSKRKLRRGVLTCLVIELLVGRIVEKHALSTDALLLAYVATLQYPGIHVVVLICALIEFRSLTAHAAHPGKQLFASTGPAGNST